MVPLIGYVDRFSARPGERIAVKVSSQLGEPYQADLVRIVHGDPNPAGFLGSEDIHSDSARTTAVIPSPHLPPEHPRLGRISTAVRRRLARSGRHLGLNGSSRVRSAH